MRRALVTGWFSFEGMGATAGDLLAPIAQRWAFLVLFTKQTFGTQQADA